MQSWKKILITGLIGLAFVYVYNNYLVPKLGTPTA
jgi:hypothetical protein